MPAIGAGAPTGAGGRPARSDDGYKWTALANTRTEPHDEIDTAIDGMMWNMVRSVPQWNG